jgi:hypothetical protein
MQISVEKRPVFIILEYFLFPINRIYVESVMILTTILYCYMRLENVIS